MGKKRIKPRLNAKNEGQKTQKRAKTNKNKQKRAIMRNKMQKLRNRRLTRLCNGIELLSQCQLLYISET